MSSTNRVTDFLLLVHCETIAMPPPQLPLELLLTIAHQFIDDHDDDDGLCFDALKSFRQVNRTLYACVNTIFLARSPEAGIHHRAVIMSLIRTNNLARLKFFLELGIDIETPLPELSADRSNEFCHHIQQKPHPSDCRCLSGQCPARVPLVEKWR
jgi:hypothetical protein